jgi:hypothetical protein
MMRMPCTAVALGAVLLAAMSLGGCGESRGMADRAAAHSSMAVSPMPERVTEGQGAGPAFLTWDGYNAEYLREAKTLRLAPGFRWPTSAPGEKVDSRDGHAVVYEVGCGTGDADDYWLATWERTWLDSLNTDPALARKALRQLLRLRETPMYREQCDAYVRGVYDEMLDQARRGTAENIAQDLELNAPELLTDLGQ